MRRSKHNRTHTKGHGRTTAVMENLAKKSLGASIRQATRVHALLPEASSPQPTTPRS